MQYFESHINDFKYYFCHKTYSTIFPFISVSLLMLIVDVPSRIIIRKHSAGI